MFFLTSRTLPTGRCVLAANLVFKDFDFLLKQIVNWNLLYWVVIIIIIIAVINVHSKKDSCMKRILGNLFNFFCVFCVVCVCIV